MAKAVTKAPEMFLYREGVAAIDTLPETKQTAGVNTANYRKLHVNVLPSGGCNPSVAILVWSDKAGRFVQMHTALTFAGIGADTPYSFTIDCDGKILFIAVTAVVAGQCDIEVSAFGLDSTL